jgi:hypothetical protein
MSNQNSNPFHYSIALEMALQEFFGHESKWYGSAGGFQNPQRVQEALVAVTTKIRKRLNEIITTDDRLLTVTNSIVDVLASQSKAMSVDNNNFLEIIGSLLSLLAHLLGYDWLKGKPNRHVIYYQTAEQQWIDDVAQHPDTMNYLSRNKEAQKRYDVVCSLYDEGFRAAEISRIMRLSEPLVRDMLADAGKIKRKPPTTSESESPDK